MTVRTSARCETMMTPGLVCDSMNFEKCAGMVLDREKLRFWPQRQLVEEPVHLKGCAYQQRAPSGSPQQVRVE